ncbi:MAG: DUF2029 domain-containing protein [Chloroflexi bacterium]|nr:MAG: DUF2029 domain-containing protein [Chloroflexota bacterium]
MIPPVTQRLRPYIPFLIVLVVEAPLLWPSDLFLGDWHNFWYAGHLVATGRSPYEVANYAGLEGPFHELEVERTSLPWPYPPWTGLFLAPFGALPLEVGLVAMHATLVVLGLAAILQLARQVRLGGAWTGALALTIAAASQPFVLATRTAHFDAALLSGVLFLAAGWQRESAWRFALGASLLALSSSPSSLVDAGGSSSLRPARSRRSRRSVSRSRRCRPPSRTRRAGSASTSAGWRRSGPLGR